MRKHMALVIVLSFIWKIFLLIKPWYLYYIGKFWLVFHIHRQPHARGIFRTSRWFCSFNAKSDDVSHDICKVFLMPYLSEAENYQRITWLLSRHACNEAVLHMQKPTVHWSWKWLLHSCTRLLLFIADNKYTCILIHTDTLTHTNRCIRTYAFIDMHIHVHMHLQLCGYGHERMYTYMYVYIYV